MSLYKPESNSWVDQIENLKGQTPSERRVELKKAYDLSKSQITNLLAVKACFDQTAFDKVRKAEKGILPSAHKALGQSNPVAQLEASQQMPFILSLNSAMALAGLKDKVDNLSRALHAALDVTLARRLATKKIKNLVKWIVSGKPASEFDPNKKMTGTPLTGISTPSGSQQAIKTLDIDKLGQLLEKAKAEKALGKATTALKKLENHLRDLFSSSSSDASSSGTGTTKPHASAGGLGISESILLDWLSDIKIIQKIKSKIKKGKDISKGEVAYLWLHKGGELLGHLVKFILKLCKPFIKIIHWAWKMVIEALKELGLYKYIKAIFTIVVLIAVIWFSWEAFHYGLIRPVEMIWSKIHLRRTVSEEVTPVPTSVPTPLPQTNLSLGLGHSTHTPRHEASVQRQIYHPSQPWIEQTASAPAWTQEDQKVLETEIESAPSPSVLKDYVLHPDETMSGNLSVSRLQDMTNPDKYTMRIGGGVMKISSVSPSDTTLKIVYKNTDAIDVFSSGGEMNIFWEDVRVIHVDEIDVQGKNPTTLYQFSLISAGAKIPLTIQCTSPDDLQHLVSTMEYFIRNSRLGHDTALAGLPYPNQGLVLNNDGVVEKLWAESPMDKAGVTWGDHLWSVGKVTSEKQGKTDLEAGLKSLPATLFVASPAEWDRAILAARSPGSNSVRPRLRKISLQPQ